MLVDPVHSEQLFQKSPNWRLLRNPDSHFIAHAAFDRFYKVLHIGTFPYSSLLILTLFVTINNSLEGNHVLYP